MFKTLKKMLGRHLAAFQRDESGAALAEYAVIFVVIAIAGAGGLVVLGQNLDTAFDNIAAFAQQIADAFVGITLIPAG